MLSRLLPSLNAPSLPCWQVEVDQLSQQLMAAERERNGDQKANAELSAKLAGLQEVVAAKEGELSRLREASQERATDVDKAREQIDRLAEQLRESEVSSADLKRQLQQSTDDLQQQKARVAKLEGDAAESQAEIKELSAKAREDASETGRLKQVLPHPPAFLGKAFEVWHCTTPHNPNNSPTTPPYNTHTAQHHTTPHHPTHPLFLPQLSLPMPCISLSVSLMTHPRLPSAGA